MTHAMTAMFCFLLAGCGNLQPGVPQPDDAPQVMPEVIGAHDEPLEAQARAPMGWKTAIRFGTPADDAVTGLAATSDGGVLVVGFSAGNLSGIRNAGARDGFLVKFDRRGVKRWTRTVRTSGDDVISRVVVDARGNIFVAGTTDGVVQRGPHTNQAASDQLETNLSEGGSLESKSAGGVDAFVIRFDARGRWRWSKQFGSAGSDGVSDLKLTGQTVTVSGVWNAPDAQGYVVSFNTNGSSLARTVFNPPSVPDAGDGTRTAWFDEFVMGTHGDAFGLSRQVAFKTSGAFALVRYGADGTVLGVTSERGLLPILLGDAFGKLFYLRPYFIAQGVAETGEPTWTALERDHVVSGVTGDADGNVYVAGGCFELPLPAVAPPSCFSSFVSKRDPQGVELERFELDVMPNRQAELFTALAVDGPTVFAAGYVSDGGTRDAMLTRFVSSK